MMDAQTLKATFEQAGFRVEIYSGPGGLLVRVLGEKQAFKRADTLAGQNGATWVSDAQTPERIAALGYPTRAA